MPLPLLPDSFVASGFVCDVRTGRLRSVDVPAGDLSEALRLRAGR